MITSRERRWLAECRNLSVGGVFVVTDDPLPEGAEGLLVLTAKRDGRVQDLAAGFRVARVSRPPAEVPGMGLQFTRMEANTRRALEALVANLGAGKSGGNGVDPSPPPGPTPPGPTP